VRTFDAQAFHAARRGALGADLRWHASLGSTQDAARDARALGAAHGCVVLAEEQVSGRGRWGRGWQSPSGAGLLFTLLVDLGASGDAACLPLVLGLATVTALRALGVEADLKWPNDVWWRGRKVAGLLVEQSGRWAYAGCGINIVQGESDWPDGLRGQAASLRQAGLNASRESVLAAVLAGWEASLGSWSRSGLSEFGVELDRYDVLKGRECSVSIGRETLRGRVLGLAPDGSLRLRLPSGEERRLQAAQSMDLRPV
jgi:BirA family biotin operon repressor/biotin-[acetyl-CoA-carboxylase] ligase